jgi:hypothetical protein
MSKDQLELEKGGTITERVDGVFVNKPRNTDTHLNIEADELYLLLWEKFSYGILSDLFSCLWSIIPPKYHEHIAKCICENKDAKAFYNSISEYIK